MKFNRRKRIYISNFEMPLFDRALIYVQKMLLPALPENLSMNIDEYDKKQLADIIKLNIEDPTKNSLNLIGEIAGYFKSWDYKWISIAFHIYLDYQQFEISRVFYQLNINELKGVNLKSMEFYSPVSLN